MSKTESVTAKSFADDDYSVQVCMDEDVPSSCLQSDCSENLKVVLNKYKFPMPSSNQVVENKQVEYTVEMFMNCM